MKLEKKSIAIFAVIAVLSFIVSFLLVYFTNHESFDEQIKNSLVDADGNVYLNVQFEDGTVELVKTDMNGNVLNEVYLYTTQKNGMYTDYVDMKTNAQGDIICLTRDYTYAPDLNGDMIIQYENEKITLYDNAGNFKKDLVVIDWSESSALETNFYIVKMQVLDNRLDFFVCNKTTWEQRSIDTENLTPYELVQTFKLKSEKNSSGGMDNLFSQNAICTTHDNRVAYVSSRGKMYVMNENHQFVDETKNVASTEGLIATDNLDVDRRGNVYFLNSNDNNIISYNIIVRFKTVLYGTDDIVDGVLSTGDMETLSLINDNGGIYFQGAIEGESLFLITEKIYIIPKSFSRPIFPTNFIKFILYAVLLIVIGILIVFIRDSLKKKFSVVFKLYAIIIPLFMALTVAFGFMLYDGTNSSFTEMRISSQATISTSLSKSISFELSQIESGDIKSNAYTKLENSVRTAYSDMVSILSEDQGCISDYVTIYALRDSKMYRVLRIYNPQIQDYISNDKEESKIRLIDTNTNSKTDNRLYNILLEMMQGSTAVSSISSDLSVFDRSYMELDTNMVGTLSPITNDEGKIIGIIENSLKQSRYDTTASNLINFLILGILLINLIILSMLYFVLRLIFKPLHLLQKKVSQIGENNWDVRLEATSKDEFGDLTNAFNFMSDRIDKYVSGIVSLNKVSMRFLPKDLFRLMNKKRIMEVSLYDKVLLKSSFIRMEFPYESLGQKDKIALYKAYFDKMNLSFNSLYNIVNRNNGIVSSYDGQGMFVLVPLNPKDALKIALEFNDYSKENYENPVIMTVGNSEMLMGVTGNESKCSISFLSSEVNSSYFINGNIGKVGVNTVYTSSIVKLLSSDPKLQFRHLGRIKGSLEGEYVDLYELLIGSDKYDKSMYLRTKKIFEFAVTCYINADFYNARKAFSNVLAINEDDKVSMYYLGLCDKAVSENTANWEGLIF